jgi:hypothetical protein
MTKPNNGLHPTPLHGAANQRFSYATVIEAETWIVMSRGAGEA